MTDFIHRAISENDWQAAAAFIVGYVQGKLLTDQDDLDELVDFVAHQMKYAAGVEGPRE